MRNFQRIAAGVDVRGLLLSLGQHPELWNEQKLRTTYPASPHSKVDDIWLKFNDVTDADAVIDDKEVISYRAWGLLPQARPIVLDLMRQVEGQRLGRVLITRLPPGEAIGRHSDQGAPAEYYQRYQLAIQCLPGCVLWVESEQTQMLTGEVWWFNNRLEHEVINNSADDRIVLISDIRSV